VKIISSKYQLMSGAELWDFLKENKPFKAAYIISPYFSQNGLSKLFEVIEPEKRRSKIQMIIRNDLLSIVTGAIDIEALEKLVNSPKKYDSTIDVKWNPNLHLKMYLFKPGNICIIGSSNLTQGGFSDHNLELNVVWKNSALMFEEGFGIFKQIWESKSTNVVTSEDINRTKRNLDSTILKNLKNSMELLRATSRKIFEFTIKDKEHQSYQAIKRIGNYIRQEKSCDSLQKYILKLGKGDSPIQSKAKILFLTVNNFIEQNEEDKIALTDLGKKIVTNPFQCFLWLSEIDPLINDIMSCLSKNRSLTYSDLVKILGLQSKDDLYPPVHWLASLGILNHTDSKERCWSLSKKGKMFFTRSINSSNLTVISSVSVVSE